MRSALLVVDMIEEFVTGRLGDERMQAIVPALKDLLERARSEGVPVFFINDLHHPGDPELEVCGEHAMEGSDQLDTIPELTPMDDEPVLTKSTYSGFYGTDLDQMLSGAGVDTLVVTGQLTEVCIKQTVADAFYRGYRTMLPSDCMQAVDDAAQEASLKEMTSLYGSTVLSSQEVSF